MKYNPVTSNCIFQPIWTLMRDLFPEEILNFWDRIGILVSKRQFTLPQTISKLHQPGVNIGIGPSSCRNNYEYRAAVLIRLDITKSCVDHKTSTTDSMNVELSGS